MDSIISAVAGLVAGLLIGKQTKPKTRRVSDVVSVSSRTFFWRPDYAVIEDGYLYAYWLEDDTTKVTIFSEDVIVTTATDLALWREAVGG